MSTTNGTNGNKKIMGQITPGNIITLVVLIMGIVATYIRSADHMNNDDIHVNDKTHKILTIEEYKSLTKFTATGQHYRDLADVMVKDLIELKVTLAVKEAEVGFLRQELEGLESKVSRQHTEVLDKLNNIKLKD